MIIVGVLLVVAGLVAYVCGVGAAPGGWWLLPAGLIAAGLGMLVAGVVARVRRVGRFRSAVRDGRGAEGGVLRRARAIPVMIVDAWRGRAALSRYQTLLWLIAVVYLVSPMDFVADVVFPLVGIPGDIGLGVWLLATLYVESGRYLAERRARTTHEITPGDG